MARQQRQLRSQELRTHNHQGDALRLGMNWTEEDLSKPQVLVESAWGMGHPGTFHFEPLIAEVSHGVFEAGGKPGVFTVSDICDGVVQATAGMSYSLVSRDVMAAMVEIHALGHPHDGMVLISGNDKSVPAHLLAMARCNLPSILLPGGTQLNAPDYVTSDQTWEIGMSVERGETTREQLESRQQTACPTCGACQFMGSASTGQVMAEALGLALPGSALTPCFLTKHLRYARATGKASVKLINEDIRARDILTREAFENAIVIHAATGGSTNALIHLPAIAYEAGVDITIDDFDRIHRLVPVLANVKTTGRYPVEYFWYAGGLPRLMLELRDVLHLDCLTVTGKTLGQNLMEIEKSRFFDERLGYLRNYKIAPDEIIRPRSNPFGKEGGIAILRGNIAPGGAIIKAFSVPKEMHVHTGPARVFDTEDAALDSLIGRHGARKVAPGEVVVIRYEGPRANGMPEMYFASAIIAADPALNHSTALITDGRYSGAMKGPCIGHVTPEAIEGGPVALVEEDDVIEINIPERRLGIVGIGKKLMEPVAIERTLAERRARWAPPPMRHTRGILSLYSRVANGSSQGASMTPHDGTNSEAVPAAAEPVSHNENAHLELVDKARRVDLEEDNMTADRKAKVVIADYDYGDVDIERSIVTGAGFELVPAQSKSEDEVIAAAADADAVLTQYAEIGKRAINSFKRCKIIARYGIGVDIVDVDEATRRNIVVTNVPNDWCMNEVADHAVALLMALARKLPQYNRATRAGEWRWQTGRPIQRLQEGTLGLFSFGAIAKEVVRRMKGFGVRSVIACDPYADERDAAAEGVALVPFDELLTRSDYLVVQAPLTKETRGRFSEAELRRMKKGAILVNTARGPIVKDEDLYRVLSDGWLGGAGLDDIEEEPSKQASWKPVDPLFSLENVIITPHAAYYSEQSIQIVRRFASEEAVRVLKGEAPLSPVNKVAMPIGIAA